MGSNDQYLAGKTVLITGGTGSLGHALVRRFLATDVRKIIIYSRDEFKQFNMERMFEKDRARLRFFIGDVRDRERLYRAFADVDVDRGARARTLRAAVYGVIVESLLADAGIRYLARGEQIQDLFGLGRLVGVNPITGPVEFAVAADDAQDARAVLADFLPA